MASTGLTNRLRPAWTPGAAERWLLDREPLGMHFGLDRMRALMDELDAPQRRFRSVHVVGTNGKSSTVRMIAALLECHGVRTGAYLSPHLVSFAERVEVGERVVDEARFAAAVQRVAAATERVDRERAPDDHVTQFEALTAAAYVELAERGVEVAVVEAGLGGRFDATSVIDSAVQVLTNVGLEHTALLGDTHARIAGEKVAVVPPGGRLVVGAGLHPEAAAVARETAARQRAALVHAPAEPSAPPALGGGFQLRNFALAEAAAGALLGALDPAAVRRAAATVRSPGRLEVVDRAPLTVVDAAHNPHGMAALVAALDAVAGGAAPVVAVVSMLSDKDADAMLDVLLPACDAVVATSNSSPRARAAGEVAALVRRHGGRLAGASPDPALALEAARRLAGHQGLVLATGSICLVGDLVGALGAPAAAARAG